MIYDLFFPWLHRFNAYISRTANGTSILLIDNCRPHGSDLKISNLSNAKVVFLLPKTTSKIQPLDVGVITCMKLRYRSFQMDNALDLQDENVCNIYKVGVLSAMLSVKPKWSELEPTIIINC